LLVVFGIVLITVWGATEWTAWRLAFQPELGAPLGRLMGLRLYWPPSFFWWWFAFDAYAPRIFLQGAVIAVSGGFIGIAASIAMSVRRGRESREVTTYGSARWATASDVRSAGLLGEDGVVLGRYEGRYLRHDGPEHVLCYAPTRSGKGVGLVVPSLLTWAGTAIVHDIKGENWKLTSGWRARIGRVLLFDPTNPKSTAYNPLLEVRRGDHEVRDVQNIADILVDPEGACASPNLVALRTKDSVVSLSDLVRSALRLRPDRIPIGEVRGPEALDLLKAWGTGHPGGVGTLHAGSALGALRRLEQLIQEAVVSVPRALIAETIDVIAVVAGRGRERRLTELVAVEGLEPTGDYRLTPLDTSPAQGN
jgi:type IV secretion system protein VirD4